MPFDFQPTLKGALIELRPLCSDDADDRRVYGSVSGCSGTIEPREIGALICLLTTKVTRQTELFVFLDGRPRESVGVSVVA